MKIFPETLLDWLLKTAHQRNGIPEGFFIFIFTLTRKATIFEHTQLQKGLILPCQTPLLFKCCIVPCFCQVLDSASGHAFEHP